VKHDQLRNRECRRHEETYVNAGQNLDREKGKPEIRKSIFLSTRRIWFLAAIDYRTARQDIRCIFRREALYKEVNIKR
jgi:hypothetical protein